MAAVMSCFTCSLGRSRRERLHDLRHAVLEQLEVCRRQTADGFAIAVEHERADLDARDGRSKYLPFLLRPLLLRRVRQRDAGHSARALHRRINGAQRHEDESDCTATHERLIPEFGT
jgi:hypothetical protein